jgi:hypothetical protein
MPDESQIKRVEWVIYNRKTACSQRVGEIHAFIVKLNKC